MNHKVSGPQRAPPAIWFWGIATAAYALDFTSQPGFASTQAQPGWKAALDQRSSRMNDHSPASATRDRPKLAWRARGWSGSPPGMADQNEPETMAWPTSHDVACQVPR